jgi:hypothetical protein
VRAQRLVIANIELALLGKPPIEEPPRQSELVRLPPHRETSSLSAATMSELKSGTTRCAVDRVSGGRRVTASRRCGCLDELGRQLGARCPNLPQTPSTGFGRTASPTAVANYARYITHDIVPSRLGAMRLTDVAGTMSTNLLPTSRQRPRRNNRAQDPDEVVNHPRHGRTG